MSGEILSWAMVLIWLTSLALALRWLAWESRMTPAAKALWAGIIILIPALGVLAYVLVWRFRRPDQGSTTVESGH